MCGNKWRLNAETSLAVPREKVLLAAESINSFIVDIKDTDPTVYQAYTGIANTAVLDNLRLLLTLKSPSDVRVRLPLIPEYNTESHRDRSEQLLRGMGVTNIERFTYVIR